MINSTFCEEVPLRKWVTSTVLVEETTAYAVEYTITYWNRVILTISQVSSAAAARALKHGYHPQVVMSSWLDRKTKAQFEGPTCWAEKPIVTPNISSV